MKLSNITIVSPPQPFEISNILRATRRINYELKCRKKKKHFDNNLVVDRKKKKKIGFCVIVICYMYEVRIKKKKKLM